MAILYVKEIILCTESVNSFVMLFKITDIYAIKYIYTIYLKKIYYLYLFTYFLVLFSKTIFVKTENILCTCLSLLSTILSTELLMTCQEDVYYVTYNNCKMYNNNKQYFYAKYLYSMLEVTFQSRVATSKASEYIHAVSSKTAAAVETLRLQTRVNTDKYYNKLYSVIYYF